MARAETIESAGENGGGRNGPLSLHNTCRMELPQPIHSRPGPRTEPSVHNNREPLPGLYLPNQLPYPHPEGHQQPQALLQTPSCRLETSRRTASSDSSQEEPDSNKEEPQDASSRGSRQGPLPDLLPQNEHSSWDSPPQQLDVIRVASQLRMIGDQFNAMILHRAHIAPQWQDWREVCWGLMNFIVQSLSTLYRLT